MNFGAAEYLNRIRKNRGMNEEAYVQINFDETLQYSESISANRAENSMGFDIDSFDKLTQIGI